MTKVHPWGEGGITAPIRRFLLASGRGDPLLLLYFAQTMRGIQVGLRRASTASCPSGDLKGATPGGEGNSPRTGAVGG